MVPKAFEAVYPNTTGFRKVLKATSLIKKGQRMISKSNEIKICKHD
jgi:hypothetical protein